MISLIIKGGLHAAIAAAYERGIKLDTIAQPCLGNETFAGVSDDKLSAVIDWYCATDGIAPYPAGSLLLYTIQGPRL